MRFPVWFPHRFPPSHPDVGTRVGRSERLRYPCGELVAVGDWVLVGGRVGSVRGRDLLTPVGRVNVDFGEVEDWVPVEDLVPLRDREGSGARFGWWLVGGVVGWGLLVAVVRAWVWMIGVVL